MRPCGPCGIREVWAQNLQLELLELSYAMLMAGPEALIAIDTEFPGVLQEDAWKKADDLQYLAMKESVDLMPPIQVGLAVGKHGRCLGAWNFNLSYNLEEELHTDASVEFLMAAGIDFERHAKEGIDGRLLGAAFQESKLLSSSWVTFQGLYDLAYLVKLLLPGPLPDTSHDFQSLVRQSCASHHELRDFLPQGSLASLMERHGVMRKGRAHAAGSDALGTLELFYRSSEPSRCAWSNSKAWGRAALLASARSTGWRVPGYLWADAAMECACRGPSHADMSSCVVSLVAFDPFATEADPPRAAGAS